MGRGVTIRRSSTLFLAPRLVKSHCKFTQMDLTKRVLEKKHLQFLTVDEQQRRTAVDMVNIQ